MIQRALKSLLSQTENDWEVIISDDGSNDGTKELIHNMQLADPRIRYIPHNHVGAGPSKSIGVKKARGKFITFLDSDDEYESDHLVKRKKILLDNDIQLLHGGAKIIGNSKVPDINNPGNNIEIKKCIIGGTMFIRDDVFNMVGEYSLKQFGDDRDFFSRAKNAGLKIFETNEQTYVYHRDTDDSLCDNYDDEK